MKRVLIMGMVGWIGLCIFLGMAQAEVSYFHADHLGSMSIATNSTGAVQQVESYTPFGETVIASPVLAGRSNLPTHYLFTNQELDRSSDLYNYGARYYDATLARFNSRDPVLPNLPYAYVRNNPVRRVDPTGRADAEATEVGQFKICGDPNCPTFDEWGEFFAEPLTATPVADQIVPEAVKTVLDGLDYLSADVGDLSIAVTGKTLFSRDDVPRVFGIAGIVYGSGKAYSFGRHWTFSRGHFSRDEDVGPWLKALKNAGVAPGRSLNQQVLSELVGERRARVFVAYIDRGRLQIHVPNKMEGVEISGHGFIMPEGKEVVVAGEIRSLGGKFILTNKSGTLVKQFDDYAGASAENLKGVVEALGKRFPEYSFEAQPYSASGR